MKRYRWADLAKMPFLLCVRFLMLLGKSCGMTYIQISVVFNLWVQGAVLVLSSILPAVMSILLLFKGYTVLRLLLACLLIGYALVNVWVFLKMLRHYRLPYSKAFYRCVDDLEELALKWHTTYQIVNLLIFVIAFLILLALNFGISYLIYLQL